MKDDIAHAFLIEVIDQPSEAQYSSKGFDTPKMCFTCGTL